jgi:hypothetical protein
LKQPSHSYQDPVHLKTRNQTVIAPTLFAAVGLEEAQLFDQVSFEALDTMRSTQVAISTLKQKDKLLFEVQEYG